MILKMIKLPGLVAIAGLLCVACSEEEVILEGQRLEIKKTTSVVTVPELVGVFNPTLPRGNNEWTHRNGTAAHSIAHIDFSPDPKLIWSQSIGSGNEGRMWLTAEPIIAQGNVFVLDSSGRVSAFTVAGVKVWSQQLTPSADSGDNLSGGGLAYGNGILVVTNGYGEAYGISPDSGAVIWRQKLEGVASSPAVISDGKAVIISSNSKAIAINLYNGRIAWQHDTGFTTTGVLGTGSPAAANGIIIMPFATGEIIAASINDGAQIWSQVLSGMRLGISRSFIVAISGDPVIKDGVIYIGTQSGRMVAIELATGMRRWSINEGALGAVWPAGDSIFVITDEYKLIRLRANDGALIWKKDLPTYEKPERFKDAYAHFGPVLAGGRIIVAGSDGVLRSFDPANGALISTTAIADGAASPPAFAAGVMYVLSSSGRLLAFQ